MRNPASRLRVLVFNWHEPYICLFAHTGHLFDVLPPVQHPHRTWNRAFRPLPPNASEVNWSQAEAGIRQGAYDLVLCLALPDLQVVQAWEVPRLFVMLNMITTDSGRSGAAKQVFVDNLRPLFRDVDLAFISEKKRRDWGWEAPVVVSGIETGAYGGYRGDLARVLRVGNMLRERDHMQGFSAQEAILGTDLPSTILGVNPGVPAARVSADWEDLKAQYRSHRLLLNTLTEEHEDGYNLGMLEAMATGMPVVSTPNSSSPIVDGENGFIAADHGVLRQRIELLLADRDLALQMGRRARQTVVEGFNIEACAAGWNEVFAQCVGRRTASPAAAPAPRPAQAMGAGGRRRLKILLAAPANPLSTSAYYEGALRHSHEVLTCGPRLDEAHLGQWKQWEDQHALKASGAGDVDKMGLLARLVRPHDLPLPWGRVRAADVAARLPAGWRPDLVVWIDAGPDFLLLDPGAFGCPTVALVGDTHTGQLQWRADYARSFDRVFLMFARQHIPHFEQAGCAQVAWLPAACEPRIHRAFAVPKAYDVVFAGQTLRQWHPDRVRLLERLQAAGFDLRVESKILEEMALLFSRGRLVFNRSLNGDLNMRVFEALSCGSLLLTDRLPAAAGLEELFTDRRHLVLYGEQDLEQLARHYLENEAEREAIAAAGHRLVWERHTYGHRADQLLAAVFGEEACASCVTAAPSAPPRPAPAAPPEPPLPAYFRNRRPEVAALVPPTARRILEVGCAAGELGRLLQERQPGTEVVGVELNPRAAQLARRHLARVIEGNIEELPFLPFAEGHFDCVVFGDVLEHLRDPEAVLQRLLFYLAPAGCLVCSIPNIRHQTVMLELMVNGRWQYRDEGLLDRTHLRFFTRTEIAQLLERLGLCAEQISASASPPLPAMEPFIRAVAALGGDAEVLRQEAQVVQYIFRAVRQPQVIAPAPSGPSLPAAAAGVRVSIVIPLFNKAELTEQCLLAIARNTGTDPDYEVLAVDNGSTDWTSYLLHAFEGDIRVLRNDENLGFARACNQGVEAATGEYVLLLNNDTVPLPGWLESLVQLADSDPRIGVVGARLLYPGSGKVQHAGLEMVGGLPEHVHRGLAGDDPRVLVQRDLDMVTGACMLVRRALFLELGGLDTAYVNGVEDVDLCLRVRQAGYRVVYCPACVVEHHEGASEGRFDRVRENLLRFQQQWGRHFDAAGRFTAAPAATAVPAPTQPGPLRGNWEGAFLVHSSLAHANRELVLALLAGGGVDLGLIPSEAGQFGAGDDPRLAALLPHLGQGLEGPVDFHLRHRWPPDFSRPASGKLVLIQPWEFGRIPSAWLEPLRAQVDQVWAYTNYVRQCYLDSGVPAEKVRVVPLGVDPQRFRPGLEPLPLPTRKPFRFLFVGGTLYRKGIDVLLAAYCRAFGAADEVCLVIKDMGVQTFYRNQNAGEQIRALQQDPANPEILYLTEDLPGSELPRLYAACDCLVHPYRGEGFGLPVAEAMACGLPAILTRGGACDDFCPEEAVFWVGAKPRQVRFEEPTAGPAWLLEPDLEGLQAQLRAVYTAPEVARRRGEAGSRHIRTHFTWERAARQARQVLAELRGPVQLVEPAPRADLIRLGEGAPGAWPYGHDSTLVLGRGDLGVQLEETRRQSSAAYAAVVWGGMAWDEAQLAQLVAQLDAHPELGALGPANAGGAAGLVRQPYLSPACMVVRLSAVEGVGGFDEAFAGPAALANFLRCCRRQGLEVAADGAMVLPGAAARWGEEQEQTAEWQAVLALEEADRCRARQDWTGALRACEAVVVAKPDFVEAILVWADVLIEQGRAQEAAGVIARLVALDPDSCMAHNYLGLVQSKAREWRAAEASFRRALELDPRFTEALVNLGVWAWEQGRAAEALGFFKEAAKLDPANRELVANLALLHLRVGQPAEAEAVLRHHLASHPEDTELQVQLAEVLLHQGKREASRLVALQVLTRDSEHPRAAAIVEQTGGKKG